MASAKELLRIYSHFQTDIENVKRRQWRDFNSTLAGQGGILFLSQSFQGQRDRIFPDVVIMLDSP